jgi:hypothetical protein
MSKVIHRFNLDLHSSQSQISIPVQLQDSARAFHITLSEGGKPYFLEDGSLVTLTVQHPSGETNFVFECTILNNTTVVHDFAEIKDQDTDSYIYTAAVVGANRCELTICNASGEIVASPKFTMVVHNRVTPRSMPLAGGNQLLLDGILTAENLRIKAEDARIEAEKARRLFEIEREDAETARIEAENARETKDAVRDTSIKNAVDASSRAEENSQNALDKANLASEAADKAAQKADGFQNIVTEVSNALKKTVQGEAVAIDDASPLEHELGVKVFRKNLIDWSNVSYEYPPDNAITYEKNSNGITIYNDGVKFSGNFALKIPSLQNLAGKTVTLSYKYENKGMRSVAIALVYKKNETVNEPEISIATVSNGIGTFKIPDDCKRPYLKLYAFLTTAGVAASITYYDLQLEIGTTATAYTPYVSAVNVKAQGKNLINWNVVEHQYTPRPGITYEKNSNGITIYNDGSEYSGSVTLKTDISNMVGKTLTLSYKYVNDGMRIARVAFSGVKNGQEESVCNADDGSGTFTLQKEYDAFRIKTTAYLTTAGVAASITYYDLQLEIGETATEYEQYKTPIIYEVGTDGVANGIVPIRPTTTLVTDTIGALIECEYNRDINKAFQELCNAIISLGGNV